MCSGSWREWGFWPSAAIPNPLPPAPPNLFLAGSPPGPVIPLRQSEVTLLPLHPNSVCQELPCGGCNEDICAAQLGGARLLQVSSALQGRWGRLARHTQSCCGVHVAVPAFESVFTKLCPAGLGGGPSPEHATCAPASLPMQILYNGQSVEVDGHSMRKLIADLQPNTEYSFVLMNRGSSAGGLQHLVSIRTAPDLLPHKPLPASAYIEDGRFTLTMPRVQEPALVRCADTSPGAGGKRAGLAMQSQGRTVLTLLCPPRWFYIMVVPIDRMGGSMLAPQWSTPEELELDEVPGDPARAALMAVPFRWLAVPRGLPPNWNYSLIGSLPASLRRRTLSWLLGAFRELLEGLQRPPQRGLWRIPWGAKWQRHLSDLTTLRPCEPHSLQGSRGHRRARVEPQQWWAASPLW